MLTKYFLFDCEMGGTDPEMSLLTLFGMVLDKHLGVTDTISLKIKPTNGRYVLSPYAMDVNKINIIEHDKDAIVISEAATEFYNFGFKNGGHTKMVPAGHNLSLDIRFVKHHLLKDDNNPDGHCWGRFFSHRRLDTASIALYLQITKQLPPELDCSLQSLAKHFGLSYDGAHNAEFDAKLTLNVLKKLIKLGDMPALY
jgi:DNA polymerase III alpha subunit (gram-positive type)